MQGWPCAAVGVGGRHTLLVWEWPGGGCIMWAGYMASACRHARDDCGDPVIVCVPLAAKQVEQTKFVAALLEVPHNSDLQVLALLMGT